MNEATLIKQKLIDFLNRYNMIQPFLIDAKASGYDVKTVDKMVATIKEENLLEDGIIIHKERQHTDTDWGEYNKLWLEHIS